MNKALHCPWCYIIVRECDLVCGSCGKPTEAAKQLMEKIDMKSEQPKKPVSDEVCPDSLGENDAWPGEKVLEAGDVVEDKKRNEKTTIPEVR
jgi:hypothetical protein